MGNVQHAVSEAKYEATTRADQRDKEAFNPGSNKGKRREGRSEE